MTDLSGFSLTEFFSHGMHGTHGSLFIASDKCHAALFFGGEYTMRVCVVFGGLLTFSS